jgi:hypothetical protein
MVHAIQAKGSKATNNETAGLSHSPPLYSCSPAKFEEAPQKIDRKTNVGLKHRPRENAALESSFASHFLQGEKAPKAVTLLPFSLREEGAEGG